MWLWNIILSIMKIASWNVNSVRTRIDNIIAWIKKEDPDILCLQEIKVVTEGFPSQPFEDLGYNLVVNGQKSYNGVATLSKCIIEENITKIPNFDDDQARYIETVHSVNSNVIRVSNIYLPNGNPYPGEKFNYKINWMKALKEHLRKRCRIKPGEDKVSVQSEGKDIELFNDQWRTAGAGTQKVATHFGQGMIDCMTKKVQKK